MILNTNILIFRGYALKQVPVLPDFDLQAPAITKDTQCIIPEIYDFQLS